MTSARFRRAAVVLAAAGALGVAGCGEDDVTDRADDLRSGASEAEIREKLDDLERDARGKGEDVEREAEQLRRDLEEELP